MRRHDFAIGSEFYCGGFRWRCTDIGTRVIVGIKLVDYHDPSWYYGPPFACGEYVFDEDDLCGCSLTPE